MTFRDVGVAGFAGRVAYCFVFATVFLAMARLAVVSKPVEDLVVLRVDAEHNSPVLHEPVYAILVIQNTQPERIEFDLGANSKTTFAVSITEPGGRTVHIPRKIPDGVAAVGRVALENGLTYTQRILLNEWYDFPFVGDYSIELSTSAVFRTNSGRALETTAIKPIFVAVQPRDERRLESICKELVTAALSLPVSAPTRNAADTAAVTLSYVKDPVAIPFLRQLLQRGRDVVPLGRYAVEGLTRIGTAEAIGILIESLGAELFTSSQSEIAAGLRRARAATTDGELRRRIDAVLPP